MDDAPWDRVVNALAAIPMLTVGACLVAGSIALLMLAWQFVIVTLILCPVGALFILAGGSSLIAAYRGYWE